MKTFPSYLQYQQAIQNSKVTLQDEHLKQGHAPTTKSKGGRTKLETYSGQFALTVKYLVGSETWAIRCFSSEKSVEFEKHYQSITKFIEASNVDFLVNIEFQRKGILVDGQWYPICKMSWVNGETLSAYISNNINQVRRIATLPENFLELVLELNDLQCAHGDLQHGNIMVEKRQLRLVDYDGMFLPEYGGKNLKASELGHPNYQHHQRTVDHFDSTIDRFSSISIYLSLRALLRDITLYKPNAEHLFLTRADYASPNESSNLDCLATIGYETAANTFRQICQNNISQVPSLWEFIKADETLFNELPDTWKKEINNKIGLELYDGVQFLTSQPAPTTKSAPSPILKQQEINQVSSSKEDLETKTFHIWFLNQLNHKISISNEPFQAQSEATSSASSQPATETPPNITLFGAINDDIADLYKSTNKVSSKPTPSIKITTKPSNPAPTSQLTDRDKLIKELNELLEQIDLIQKTPKSQLTQTPKQTATTPKPTTTAFAPVTSVIPQQTTQTAAIAPPRAVPQPVNTSSQTTSIPQVQAQTQNIRAHWILALLFSFITPVAYYNLLDHPRYLTASLENILAFSVGWTIFWRLSHAKERRLLAAIPALAVLFIAISLLQPIRLLDVQLILCIITTFISFKFNNRYLIKVILLTVPLSIALHLIYGSHYYNDTSFILPIILGLPFIVDKFSQIYENHPHIFGFITRGLFITVGQLLYIITLRIIQLSRNILIIDALIINIFYAVSLSGTLTLLRRENKSLKLKFLALIFIVINSISLTLIIRLTALQLTSRSYIYMPESHQILTVGAIQLTYLLLHKRIWIRALIVTVIFAIALNALNIHRDYIFKLITLLVGLPLLSELVFSKTEAKNSIAEWKIVAVFLSIILLFSSPNIITGLSFDSPISIAALQHSTPTQVAITAPTIKPIATTTPTLTITPTQTATSTPLGYPQIVDVSVYGTCTNLLFDIKFSGQANYIKWEANNSSGVLFTNNRPNNEIRLSKQQCTNDTCLFEFEAVSIYGDHSAPYKKQIKCVSSTQTPPSTQKPTQTPIPTAQLLGIITSSSSENVNLRSGPGTHYEILRTIRVGTRVNILEAPQYSRDWYYIQSGQSKGWVSKLLVHITQR